MTTVEQLHRAWVFGWERAPHDPPFDFAAAQGRHYAEGEVLLYDDFDPEHRTARTAREYGAVWEPAFRDLRLARHTVVSGPHVLESGDLAASTLVFEVDLETADGTRSRLRTTTSLVWRRGADGWRIVREHNSSVRL
ncbi:YybH family protein [Actinosynnema sp.]|uniref:YybH family protein n=1 Tax=Actinosynnema sp. TaxID=1872144 RepID=UPI003F83199A